MESVEILKISKSLPQEIFDNIGIPICYTVNKQDYYKLPNYLYTNKNELSDEKIDDLTNLANINKKSKKKQRSKKNLLNNQSKAKSKKIKNK